MLKFKSIRVVLVFSIIFTIFCCSNENESIIENNETTAVSNSILNARATVGSGNSNYSFICEYGVTFFIIPGAPGCINGQTLLCDCTYGFADCNCYFQQVPNTNTIEPYTVLLEENNMGDVLSSFNAVIASMNTESYSDSVMDYKNTVDALDEEKQAIITEWLAM